MTRTKIKLHIILIMVLAMPFNAGAVNDVTLNGIVNFQLNTIDAVPVLTTILGQNGGIVTSINVQNNYIDVTLDAGSDITFNTTGGLYFNLPNPIPAGVTTTPATCIQGQIRLQATANGVVRLEVTSTAPVCPGGGGHTYIYPTNYSLEINNGASCTASRNVILNLASQNASQVIVSNNENFIGSDWESFINPTDKSWLLEAGDGIKTVYAIYRSLDGSTSPILTDSIELKTAGCEVSPPEQPEEPEEPVTPEVVTPLPGLNFGDLLKGSFDAVYYYDFDGKRHVFPTLGTYNSWYDDFSQVKIISDSTLAQIALGKNMTYKPGVRMLKIESDPKVYAVDEGAVLRWIITEEIAQSLYGPNWAGYIDDLNVAFWVDYTIGDPINDLTDYNLDLIPDYVKTATTPVIIEENVSCSSAMTFTLFLELEDENDEVKALQELLKCLAYFPQDTEATGYFGPMTEEAVKKFQAANEIEVAGYVGPQTRAALNKY